MARKGDNKSSEIRPCLQSKLLKLTSSSIGNWRNEKKSLLLLSLNKIYCKFHTSLNNLNGAPCDFVLSKYEAQLCNLGFLPEIISHSLIKNPASIYESRELQPWMSDKFLPGPVLIGTPSSSNAPFIAISFFFFFHILDIKWLWPPLPPLIFLQR